MISAIINTVMGVSILIVIFSFMYSIKIGKHYENCLEKERMIFYLSDSRMKLMEMIYLGELNVNSNYFKYMFSAISYSIRALYFYDNKSEALKNISIIKESAIYLNKKIEDEFKTLNNSQKELFYMVTCKVLKIYLETHFFEKILFLYLYKITKNFLISIPKRFKSKRVERRLQYPIQLEYYSNIAIAA